MRAAVPDPCRQAGSAGHDLPARQAADALLERPERVGRRGDGRDHLLHQRHQLVGRLRVPSPTRTRRRWASRASCGCSTTRARQYEDAQVRLVVGKINLVEKIAQLAQMPGPKRRTKLRRRVAAEASCGKSAEIDAMAASSGRRPAGGRQAADGEAEADHQGGPERILHLHHRRHGDDPQRLVQADAELRGPDGAVQDPVPLPARRVRRPAGADVPADQRQGIEARHHAAAGRHGPGLPRERPGRALASWWPSRSSTSPSATRSS